MRSTTRMTAAMMNKEEKEANKGTEEAAFTLRKMEISDFEEVHGLWMQIHGFAIRSIDDAKEGVERFLKRNPGCSVVALDPEGKVIGTILCGHDGRTACFYHVCVREDWRRHGVGKAMVTWCMRALQKEKVSKISLVAFRENAIGNHFWNQEGWTKREDINSYDFVLNEDNIIRFNA